MIPLPHYAVLDSRLERLPRDALRALQSERLRAMVRYVYAATPFWRRKMDAAGLRPDDIRGVADLPRLPFCTKSELLQDQAETPPAGSYAGTHPSAWVRFFSTSGTTGRPLRRVFSARDWGYLLDRFRRNPPLGPGEVALMLGPCGGLLGPTAGVEGLQACGGLVVHAARYDTKKKIELIRDLRPVIVNGSCSYLLHIADQAREMGVDLTALGIRAVISVGEPGAAIAGTRARLESGWGAFVNDGFGLTEIFPLGGACPHSRALHIPDDLVATEIVDPETGEPVAPGEPGEVVFTNLVGDTQPLLRYRSRDIARIAADEPCRCGFTGTLLANSIEGRADDMIWYKGMNIFPGQVEAVVRGFERLGDEYVILVSGDVSRPTLTVRAELRDETAVGDDTADRLVAALHRAIGVRFAVELIPHGTLPRTEDRSKTRRVVDARRNA